MGTSSQETQTHSTTDTTPWAPQQPYILQGLADAQKVYEQRNAAGPYGGDFVAPPNQNQFQSFDDALKWSTTTARDFSNQQLAQGNALYNAGLAYQGMGAKGLSDWATTNHIGDYINQANQIANAGNVSDQVRAAMADSYRTASENTLPTLYRGAGSANSLNSDRVALAQGVVQRGLNDQAGNLSAQLRASLFNQGLQAAQAQGAQQLSAYGALGNLGTSNLQTGANLANSGFTNYGKALGAQQAAAFGQQGLAQNKIDNDLKKWYNNYEFAQNNLNDYWRIAGDVKGQHSVTDGTQTTTQTPSLISQIGQGIGIFGSLFSDARFKTILSDGPVGEWKGFPLYVYSYDFAPDQIHVGLMAQDIAAVRPDAVTEVFGKLIIDLNVL